jgi:hypothetical protein
VADVVAGTAPFIATAPLFPASLAGLSAQFAAVSATSELGRQRADESLMKPVAEKYAAQLLAEGSVTQEEMDTIKKDIWDKLEANYESSKNYKASSKEWVSSSWSGIQLG